MNIKSIIFAAITLLFALTSVGAETIKTQKKNGAVTKRTKENSMPAKGPVSFGSMKIGMSKAAIEALTVKDDYYLKEPFADPVYREELNKMKESYEFEGIKRLQGLVINPFSIEPLKVGFIFKKDALEEMWVDVNNKDLFNKFKSMVENKYGKPATSGVVIDKQCINKDGSNFTIQKGSLIHRWSEKLANAPREEIKTSFTSALTGICPSAFTDPTDSLFDKINSKINEDMYIFLIDRRKITAPKPDAF